MLFCLDREARRAGSWRCLWWVKPSTCPMWRMDGFKLQGPREMCLPCLQGKVRKWFIFSITSPRMISLLCVSGQSPQWERGRPTELKCGKCAITWHPHASYIDNITEIEYSQNVFKRTWIVFSWQKSYPFVTISLTFLLFFIFYSSFSKFDKICANYSIKKGLNNPNLIAVFEHGY